MKRVDELVKLQSCDACGKQAFGVVDNPTKELKKVVCLNCGATFENGVTPKETKKEDNKKTETIKTDQDTQEDNKKNFTERMKEIKGMLV